MQETWVRSLGWEDPLEKGKAIHSSILAWRTPWTMQKVRHDSATFTFHEATNAPYTSRVLQWGCGHSYGEGLEEGDNADSDDS